MRSRVSPLLTLVALSATPAAAQVALPPEAASASGPSGTAGTGEPSRFDAVVRAGVDPSLPGLAVATPALPAGSHAEVTLLSSGRTILLPVVASEGPRLSEAAAQALGLESDGGIRIRAVTASPADSTALRQGQPASPRLDTPEAVLRALRRQLPAETIAPTRRLRIPKAPVRPARPADNTVLDVTPPPPTSLRVDKRATVPDAPADVPLAPLIPPAAPSAPVQPAATRFVVQIAVAAQEEAARNLARRSGGTVARSDAGWQVRLGPFIGLPAAQAARDEAVARGYADAAIFLAD